jgi:hypothetical protein
MASAIGMYYACRERAFTSRMAALKAAKEGRSEDAIALTRDAQRHDRLAEEWQAKVPEWQWQIGYSEGEA